MKNLKVRAKLIMGFVIVAVIGIILGVVGIISLQFIKAKSAEVVILQETNRGASNVLNAHYTWRHGLTEAVMNGGEFTGSLDPNNCALGRFLDSDAAKNIKDTEVNEYLRQIESPHRFIHTEARATVAYVQAGELDHAKQELVSNILPTTQEVITLLSAITNRFDDLIEEKNKEILDLENFTTYGLLGVIIAAALVSVLMAISIANLIGRPIASLTSYLDRAGLRGDLTFSNDEKDALNSYSKYKDELGQLTISAMKFVEAIVGVSDVLEAVAGGDITPDAIVLSDKDTIGLSLKHTLDNLNTMFSEIHDSTNQVSSGSKQVADGAQSLAQGSSEQAAAIEELSSSIADIAERIKVNAETAEKTANLSNKIKFSAEKGSNQMNDMIVAVGEINDAGKNIRKIIKTIDDIAFQTNILALNAAVEAARAGAHGKGFAVVAEEVRNLASKSAEAAKDTGAMIQNSIEKAELGSRIAGETAASLNEIVAGINESSLLIAEIASASEQQSMGISHINIGIDQVAQVTQQNSATAQESAAASEEMSSQSDMLQQLIAQFKLKDSGGMYPRAQGSITSRGQAALPQKPNYALPDKSKRYAG